MDKLTIEKVRNTLSNKSHPIVIVSHVNPDGDAIGSSLGMYKYLKNAGYQHVQFISPNSFPSFLQWMPNAQQVMVAEHQQNQAAEWIRKAEVIFCLDFNDLERTDFLASKIQQSEGTKILIDHHPDPKDQFDIVISDIHVSSTAELVYNFIQALQHDQYLDTDIANCLYAGIITDTGSLSYACNNPRTYYIIGNFIQMGVDGEKVHRLIYDTYSEDRMRLLGHCLTNNLKVVSEHRTAYIFLSAGDLKKFNYKEGDTEGVVNYALSIKGISLAAIFIEKENQVKISFRSEGNWCVNKLAASHFNGGGHKNAAGGSYKDSLINTLRYFERILTDIAKDDFNLLKDMSDYP